MMADFVRVPLDDNTEVLFEEQSTEPVLGLSAGLVSGRSTEPVSERSAGLVSGKSTTSQIKDLASDAARVDTIAQAAGEMSRSLREKLSPDELSLEIGIGLSGEVGWFFAKSAVDASVKVTLTWKNLGAAQPTEPTTKS